MAENKNFDLSKHAIQEFESKDIQKLLDKFKNNDLKITEKDLKILDKDDNTLSETEKKLKEELKDKKNIILFLEGILKQVEQRELKDKQEEKNKQMEKEKLRIKNKIDKFLEKYNINSLNGLIQNKQARREFLKLDDLEIPINFGGKITYMCPIYNFKNGKDNIPIAKINTEIINQENKDLKAFLEKQGIKDSEITNIIDNKDSCKSIDLGKKLKEFFKNKSEKDINSLVDQKFKKASKEEKINLLVNQVLKEVSGTKKTIKGFKIDQELKKAGINNKEEFKKLSKEEQIKILTEKGINKENQAKILNDINTYKKAEKTEKISSEEIEKLQEQMEEYSEKLNLNNTVYNKIFNNEVFLNKPDLIINITNKDKLINVLQEFIKKGKKINKHFIEFINSHFHNDLDILELFTKISTQKLDTKDIMSFNYNTFLFRKSIFKGQEQRFFKLLKPKTLRNFLILNYNFEEITEFAKKYDCVKKLDLKWIKEKIDIYNNNISLNNFDIKKIINTYANKIDLLYTKPEILKTILSKQDYIVLSKQDYIVKFITKNPEFYDKFLSNEQKKQYAYLYMNQVRKHYKNKDTKKEYELYSKVKLGNAKQIRKVFITFHEWKINFQELLNYPSLKSQLIEKLNDKQLFKEFQKFPDGKKIISEMLTVIGKYVKQDISAYKLIIDTSGLKNIVKNNINNISDNKLQKIADKYEKINKKTLKDFIEALSSGKNTQLEKITQEIATHIPDVKTFNKLITQLKNIFKQNEQVKNKNSLNKLKKEEIEKLISEKILDQNGNLSEKEKKIFQKFILKNKEQYEKNKNKLILIENYVKTKYKNYSTEAQKLIIKQLKQIDTIKLINYIQKSTSINNPKAKQAFENLKNNSEKYWNEADKEITQEYIQEIKEYEEKYGEIEVPQIPKITNINNNQNDILQTNNYSFSPDTGNITIFENGKEETIKLSPEEQKLIQKNPETLNNIINFYKTLNKLGLKKLWTIKEQLFKSIENVTGIGFRIDGNYLNENEIKIFLNKILKSIGEKEISPILNLKNFLSRIETLNKNQIGGNEKIVNNFYKETYIENKLFEKFVGRNNTIIGFKQSKFEEAIK